MKHADPLIERILFLEGLPNLQDIGKLRIGENVQELLKCDPQLEVWSHTVRKGAIPYCESCGDFVSRELLDDIIVGEEEHIDWLETRLELIDKVGIQNYQQSQM